MGLHFGKDPNDVVFYRLLRKSDDIADVFAGFSACDQFKNSYLIGLKRILLRMDLN